MMAHKPGWDLAYLLCTNIQVDLRREIYDESCKKYLDGINSKGIEFTEDQLEEYMMLSLLAMTSFPVIGGFTFDRRCRVDIVVGIVDHQILFHRMVASLSGARDTTRVINRGRRGWHRRDVAGAQELGRLAQADVQLLLVRFGHGRLGILDRHVEEIL